MFATAGATRQVYIRNRTNPRPVAGTFGLADAIFPGAGRGLEQDNEWFTVYVVMCP
jgi:hypothetical protein